MTASPLPNRPKTLLQMAGVAATPAPWDQSILLLIDCQEEYISGLLPLPGVEAAIAEAAILLQAARAKGVPVVHVVHRGRTGGAFDPDGPGYAIASALTPQPDEAVVPKPMPNGFEQTTLAETLAATAPSADGGARKTLIVGGFMTHNCISSTVRAALDLGYLSTVVASACGTRPLPDPLDSDSVMDAATLNHVVLTGLADRHGVVIPTAQALIAALG
jgi:nicotinamidase-related amidase